MTIYERRFRPEFMPAFRAWLAQQPFTNPRAIPGPQYMPQYRLAETARAASLDAQGDKLYLEGTNAKSNDDKYILSTVFFAAVLFFAGISCGCCGVRSASLSWDGRGDAGPRRGLRRECAGCLSCRRHGQPGASSDARDAARRRRRRAARNLIPFG